MSVAVVEIIAPTEAAARVMTTPVTEFVIIAARSSPKFKSLSFGMRVDWAYQQPCR